ncbi:hypothetical protein [Kocuria sabuli]|uniref:hypothetical protein n=1 Tax=Kocuria sabuli TaxID=3071448 RepID=UPI0034D4C0B1
MSGPPESIRAARVWDTTRDHYADAGLCDRCAAQAAYGHAEGFGKIHPPCCDCAQIVSALPVQRSNGWRSWRRGQDGPKTALPEAA